MRILIVNTYYYPNMIGGTEQSVKLLAEGLKKQGHEVFVLTGDKDKEEYEVVEGINIIRLDLKNKANFIEKLLRKGLEFNNFFIKSKVEEIFDKIMPDVVHTNNLFYISPIIWKIAKSRNIKVVHTLRDYWGMCPKTTLLNHNMQICSNKKVLCKVHMKNYINFSRNVDVVTAPSQFTLDLYNKNGIFNESKNIMIPNAIDIDINEHLKIIEKRKLKNSESIKYLFIGSLHEHKGIEYLIESFRDIKNENISLTICGDGPLKEFVEKSCKNDKRISYLGCVFKEEKEKVLLDSDIMIVPSIWYEPFGRVVIEAYKYGLPVIACKIGGINELLSKEISIGIREKNKDDLRNAILTLSNRYIIKEYINNIHKYIDIYNIDKQIDNFIKVYNYKN